MPLRRFSMPRIDFDDTDLQNLYMDVRTILEDVWRKPIAADMELGVAWPDWDGVYSGSYRMLYNPEDIDRFVAQHRYAIAKCVEINKMIGIKTRRHLSVLEKTELLIEWALREAVARIDVLLK